MGVVGAPNFMITVSSHDAVDLLIQPRNWPQSVHSSLPACGPLPALMTQMLRQHGRSRSTGRSIFTLRPTRLNILVNLLVGRDAFQPIAPQRRLEQRAQRLNGVDAGLRP